MKECVERILDGMHALGSGGREPPLGDHLALTGQFDSTDRASKLDIEARRTIERPCHRLDTGAMAGRRGIRQKTAVGEHDPSIGEPKVLIEIEAAR